MINKDKNRDHNIPTSFFGLFRWAYSPHKSWLLFFIITTLISSIFFILNSYLLKQIVDILGKLKETSNTGNVIFWYILLIIINFFVHEFSWQGPVYANLKIAPIVKNKIINSMFVYVHKHSQNFFLNNPAGSISDKIDALAERFTSIFYLPTTTIIRGIMQFCFAILSIAFISPILSISLFIWAVLFTIIKMFFSNKIRKFSDDYSYSSANLYGKIVDSISNSANVRIFSRIDYESKYLRKYLNDIKKKYKLKELFVSKISLIQGMLLGIFIGFVILLLIKFRSQGLISIGDFAFVLTLLFAVTDSVWYTIDQFDVINDYIGECDQSLRTLIIPLEIKDVPNAKKLKVTQGNIEIKNIYFKYDKGNKDFIYNCSIPALQKVGLVGFSGSGKSTFVNLILRIYDTKSGSIFIDNQEIKEVTQKSLRENISVITQDSSLFDRTLNENIKYGKIDATKKEILIASKKAYVDEIAKEMSKGYNSNVGEKGNKLSGGQRQRVNIARAILKDAPILIVDEATSSLDSLTEKKIQDSINKTMKDKTCLVIAHKFTTLTKMDRILVFDQGRIIEDGTHNELLKKGKTYKKLWDQQVGGFLPDEKINNN
ncbi:MAG: ABC transporter ATP-binding protein [Bacteroidetes bacterium]|nr:ABC transporter ATP-binding protein [Bacteroidota bacterium]